ncbi:MAG: glycosyltransferase family 4 protein, partial [Deltaproteobacteria bacterium]|nr:glycosyltransferase family 4 protein [Deltaproteobacteria bacterium]
MRDNIKVALVHDWLTGMRGGEYVLEAIAEIFPKADLYTLLCLPEKISPILATLKRHTSWLQKVPFAEKRYRSFLPLMPHMIETFKLNDYDLIISSSHCVAKGIIK